ncbi:hypothetical protein B296_00037803, partial [Ensete ventricosum]
PPPTDDDPPASFLEKVVPVVLQLSLSAGMVASVDPTGRNHGHELAFKLYHLAVLTIYGFDITLGICPHCVLCSDRQTMDPSSRHLSHLWGFCSLIRHHRPRYRDKPSALRGSGHYQ